jgi:hypothetical protein
VLSQTLDEHAVSKRHQKKHAEVHKTATSTGCAADVPYQNIYHTMIWYQLLYRAGLLQRRSVTCVSG